MALPQVTSPQASTWVAAFGVTHLVFCFCCWYQNIFMMSLVVKDCRHDCCSASTGKTDENKQMQPIHGNAVFLSECSLMVVSVFHITSQIHHPYWIRWSEWTSGVKKKERRSLSLCHQCNWQSQTEIVWISDLWLNIYFWCWWDYLHQVDVALSHSHTMTQHLYFEFVDNLDVLCFWCFWCFW